MSKQEELQRLQIQIVLEELEAQRQKWMQGAIVEPIEDGFIIHGYRDSNRAKGEDCYLPGSQTIAAKDFWEIHPSPDLAYRIVGKWLLEN